MASFESKSSVDLPESLEKVKETPEGKKNLEKLQNKFGDIDQGLETSPAKLNVLQKRGDSLLAEADFSSEKGAQDVQKLLKFMKKLSENSQSEVSEQLMLKAQEILNKQWKDTKKDLFSQ